jgi:hypothetical protein
MPVHVFWDNANLYPTVHINLKGRWTWDEVKRGVREAYALIEGVSGKIPYIVSVENQLVIPGHFLRNGREVLRPLHPRTGLMVVVTREMLVLDLLFAFLHRNRGLGGREYSLATTVEQARDVLKRRGYGPAASGSQPQS